MKKDNGAPAIEAKGLCRRFGTREAVRGLELTVPAGECFALLGVNGAGKTTAIRMLSCLLRPTAGDALVMGHSIVSDPAAAKAVTGLSPQETAVGKNLTARENLELMAGLYGANSKAAKQMAAQMIERLGLREVAQRRAGVLSGGWQRRLSIAMGLIGEPKVLFLDEPTLGLDVLARRELWRLLEGLRGRTTILLTTHYLEEAAALADRIGIMANGRLVATGTVPELCEAAGVTTLEDAFVALATDQAGKEGLL